MRYFKIGDSVLSKTYGTGKVKDYKEECYVQFPVVVFFVNGKTKSFTISGRNTPDGEIDLFQLDSIIFNENKPIQDEYVPFDFSYAANLIGNVIKHKNTSSLSLITNVCKKGISASRSGITYQQLLDNYEFQDGSTCGKIKK